MSRAGYETGRRRLRVFAFLIAGAFVVLGLVTWWAGRVDPREGSRVISRGGEALEMGDIPTTYRATYRIDHYAAGEVTTNTERVWVNRPFESRVESWSGPPPGVRRTETRQSAFGALAVVPEDPERQQPLFLAAAPSLSSGDLRIDPLLKEATEGGTLLLRERREVFGRECQVYRAGDSVFAGDITPYEGGGSFADVCVDANGIILEEAWFQRGEMIRRRVITELEAGVPIDRSLFAIEIGPTPGVNSGAVERIPDEDPSVGPPLWSLPEPPAGFQRLGRYGVVLSEQTLPQQQGLGALAPASIADVYVRGPDIVVVDQDPSLEQLAQREGRRSTDVDLGELGEGQLITDARSSEVRVRTPEGSFVRVFGTLPPSELVELARQLRPPTS